MVYRLSCFIIFLMLVGCAQTDLSLQDKLIQQVHNNALHHGIPSQAVLISNNGNIQFNYALDTSQQKKDIKLNEHSMFPIFSVSKLFANVLVYQLVEQEQIKLSDRIGEYVKLPSHWQHIPINALLNHTSGLPEYFVVSDQEVVAPSNQDVLIEKLGAQQPIFELNTQIQYTQTNYMLLKALLESLTGQPYESLVKTRIFSPLKMSNTAFHVDDLTKGVVRSYLSNGGDSLKPNGYVFPRYSSAHTGAYSTAYDLNLFLSGLMEGKLINKALLVDFWRPQKLKNGITNYFALGWDTDEVGRWSTAGHDGGTLVRVSVLYQENTDDYMTYIYLTNGNLDGIWSSRLINSLQQHTLPDFYSRAVAWVSYNVL
ncbi:serine hydrolase domain-containing protein [Pseudoalteromonas umbrosa]|uniref:serine hydrolase domain-containing protein n=1 Tax=Pseudoalteromonas umbrosa TaxID=3048489 RepID=UPI0024C31501|nr:serine hydrolase domain-containing protein [Pseudoalteromonas sp. B95]MDK1285667.1 serine hydrolase domain-containing protein [Pseudoalteromonas sp. B95]